MERIVTAKQMRDADDYTINKLGVCSQVLIERAGAAVAQEITKRFKGGRVLVCVGNGNNGADGRVVADILSKIHGFNVAVFTVSNGMFKIFEKKFDIIVDCIFGTGLNRVVEGKYRTVIEYINNSNAYVISCDVPSGLNADNGQVMGVCVKANLTIAIQEYKTGHFLGNGIDYSGELACKDIGISFWEDEFITRVTDKDLSKYFSERRRNVHKGLFGKACVIGGSRNYSGSIVLSANALCALKMGVGYATLTVPESLFDAYVGKVPECILSTFPDSFDNVNDGSKLEGLLSYNSISVGMGMGKTKSVYNVIKYLLENYTGRLIIDADGLNCLSEFGLNVLKNKKCDVVLTPHIGEFCRLSTFSKQEILENPIECAKTFAKDNKVILVLKNAVTIITDGEKVVLNTSGCSGLAKGGSGDVLSGVMAGILARSEDLLESVSASAYLFGRAGELAEHKQNAFTITASDVINQLPNVINSL